MPNLIPQDIREWMRRVEFKQNDLTRRLSNLIPGEIADAVDLDGYMSSGRWVRQSGTGTTTALNYPQAGAAGVLEVYQSPPSTNVVQTFTDRVSKAVWVRHFNGVSWAAWGANSYAGAVAIVAPAGYTSAATSRFIAPGVVLLSGTITKTVAPLVRATTFGTVDAAHVPATARRVQVAYGTATPVASGVSALAISTAGALQLTAANTELASQTVVFLDGVMYVQ